MMRILFLFLECSLCISAFAQVPGLVSNTMKKDEKGISVTVQTHTFRFHSAVMTLTSEEEQSGRIRKVSMGLDFGRIRNGGWSIWNFFSVLKNNRPCFHCSSPEVSMRNFDGMLVADIHWKFTDVPPLQLRIIQFQNEPEWLYMRIKGDLRQNDGLCFNFSMYPGGANWNIKERERLLITSDTEYSVSKQAAEIFPSGNGIIAANNYWHDDYGEFLIFEHEKIQRIFSPHTTNEISLRMTPKKQNDEFYFALGYYFNKPKQESISRFLNEQVATISARIRTIPWEIRLNPETFYRELRETRELCEKERKWDQEISALEESFGTATPAEQGILLDKLLILRKTIITEALKRFQ